MKSGTWIIIILLLFSLFYIQTVASVLNTAITGHVNILYVTIVTFLVRYSSALEVDLPHFCTENKAAWTDPKIPESLQLGKKERRENLNNHTATHYV